MIDLIADRLVDPTDRAPLQLLVDGADASGKLVASNGTTYPIRDGIPRFVEEVEPGQAQTADSFAYKWARTDTYSSRTMRAAATRWLLKRYGFKSPTAMRHRLEVAGSVLDVGCGGGLTASLWIDGWSTALYVGLDVSAAVDIAHDRLRGHPGTAFVQGDALQMPFPDESFGAVISEGVFHHTPSTKQAIAESARVLSHGGEMLFYVYRRKSAVREFADDHVRAYLAALSNPEAWEEMERLTDLAKALHALNAQIEIRKPIRSLGIPAGRIDVQRLIYWHLAKAFWNDEYSFDENVHVNFDWYRPQYAHRQSEEEVRDWCAASGLQIFRFDLDDAGFTVRATKKARKNVREKVP